MAEYRRPNDLADSAGNARLRSPTRMLHNNAMRGLTSSYLVKTILAALFLWVQGAALYDAAAHGEQPHDHYGVSCELTTAVKADIAPLPAAPVAKAIVRAFIAAEQAPLDYRPWSHPPGRGPPPRSPPHLDQ